MGRIPYASAKLGNCVWNPLKFTPMFKLEVQFVKSVNCAFEQ